MPSTASAEVSPDKLEEYRRELTGYCYRMLGSGFEADDAVQETMVRAWRAADGFEGRSSVRSWLSRIATNIRLAFVTPLQHLPARQRASLILCEVLRMPAAEAAATLGTSVPAVNSALQRARATLAALPEDQRPVAVEADQADLLAKYVDAFQRYDLDQLVTLPRLP